MHISKRFLVHVNVLTLIVVTFGGCTVVTSLSELKVNERAATLTLNGDSSDESFSAHSLPELSDTEIQAKAMAKAYRSQSDILQESVEQRIAALIAEANNQLSPLFFTANSNAAVKSVSDLDKREAELRLRASPIKVDQFKGGVQLYSFAGQDHMTSPRKVGQLTEAHVTASIDRARQLLAEAGKLSASGLGTSPTSSLMMVHACSELLGNVTCAQVPQPAVQAWASDQMLGRIVESPIDIVVSQPDNKNEAFAEKTTPPHASVKGETHSIEPQSAAIKAKETLSSTGFTVPALSTNLLTALDEATRGNVAISAPNKAVVGTPFTVVLKVGVDELGTLLKELADEVPENTNRTGNIGIKLTPRMSASLSGIGFEIIPQGISSQAVLKSEPTTWLWQAKGTKSGTLSLHFSLWRTVVVDGKEINKNYSFRKVLQVEVKPFSLRDFMGENWQVIVTVLLIPLVKMLWDLLRKKQLDSEESMKNPVIKIRNRFRRP